MLITLAMRETQIQTRLSVANSNTTVVEGKSVAEAEDRMLNTGSGKSKLDLT